MLPAIRSGITGIRFVEFSQTSQDFRRNCQQSRCQPHHNPDNLVSAEPHQGMVVCGAPYGIAAPNAVEAVHGIALPCRAGKKGNEGVRRQGSREG